jgi:Uma2 family endonuclease
MATITPEATTVEAITPAPPGDVTGYRPHEITVDELYRMNEAGVFPSRPKIFLLEGRLYEKMAPKRPHVIAADSLVKLLDRALPKGWCAVSEQPIVLGDRSQPEPDVSVVRGTPRDYPERPPTARDVGLLAEVADSTLPDDTGVMLRLYARCGIPVYWVVNLPNRRIDVYTGPSGPADAPSYADLKSYGPEDEVPLVLDGREVGRVAVRDVLP